MIVRKSLLKVILTIDGLIAIAFGVFSLFFPQDTFGEIIAIPEGHASVFTAILSALSLFYIVVGTTCLIAAFAEIQMTTWIGLLMLVRHLSEGTLKLVDMNKEWAIGNPYQDIIIHTLFSIVYLVAIVLTYNHQKKKLSSV